MAELTDKIVIHFEPKGEQGLTAAIKALDRATKSMMKTQASMADFQKSGFTQTEKGRAAYIRLKNTMKSYDKTLLDVTKDTNLLALAQKGDTVALMKLSRATRKYTSDLDRNRASILSTNHGTRILGGSFAVLRSKLLVTSFAIGIVNAIFTSAVKTFAKQEAVNEKLAIGLSNIADTTDGVTQRLIDYSSALQRTTAFGDELITNGMVQLTTFGLSEKAIKALTPQVLNVARAIQTTSGAMPDLNSLFIAFGKATSTAVSALTRYGVVLTDTEKAQLTLMDANERAVAIGEILDKQYGGLAKAYAKTTAGMLDAASAARGDAAEAFGEVLAPAILAVANASKVMAESLTPENIKLITSGLAAAGVAAVGWALYNGALSASLVALAATLTTTSAGLYGLAILFGVVTAATLKYFGVFASEGDAVEDIEKRIAKLKTAIEEASKAQEDAIKISKNYTESLEDEHTAILVQIALLENKSRVWIETYIKGNKLSTEQLAIIKQIIDAQRILDKMTRQDGDDSKVSFLMREIGLLSLKKLELEGATELEILRFKFGAKFLEQNEKLVANYIAEKEGLKALTDAKRDANNTHETTNTLLDAEIRFLERKATIQAGMVVSTDKLTEGQQAFVDITGDLGNAAQSTSNLLAAAAGEDKNRQIQAMRIAQFAAIANTASAATKALGNPLKLIAVLATGAAQVVSINNAISQAESVQAYAKGGDFITNKPEMIMVGEAGREHVKITPIDRPESRALKDGMTINFNNAIMSEDFTRDQIIPQIQQAVRMNLA